jgi:uncharacterized membrane protein YdjX (TVP38/TMEM64 family)
LRKQRRARIWDWLTGAGSAKVENVMPDPKAAIIIRKEGETGSRRAQIRRFVPIAVILAGLAAGYLMGWHEFLSLDYLAQSRDRLIAFADAHPLLAPALFFIAYVAAVAFSFPAATILTIFGGFLFGWLLAGILVAFAATIGATLLFLAARSAFGDLLRARIGGRVAQLAEGFEKNAFGYLLVLRLAPVFPFFIVNIAPAFFKVPLHIYITATFLGILPGVFAYAYLGEGVDSVILAARTAGEDISLADLVTPEITIAFAALASVAAIPLILRAIRGRRLP